MLAPLAWPPLASVDTRVIAPVTKSLTKMSATPLVSPGTRLVADETKTTFVPSADQPNGPVLSPPVACPPLASVDTRVIVPVVRSFMKRSWSAVGVAGHQVAGERIEQNLVPSGEKAPLKLLLLPCAPFPSVDTRVIAPVSRSLTNMSWALFVSPATRLLAVERNANLVPSGGKGPIDDLA